MIRALVQSMKRGRRAKFLALLAFAIAVVLAPHCADAFDFPGVAMQGATGQVAAQIANSTSLEAAAVDPAAAGSMTAEPARGLPPDNGLYGACVSLLLGLLMALVVIRVAPLVRRGRFSLYRPQVNSLIFARPVAPLDLGICRT